ncbi:hypothetical protein KIV66_gp91 [Mycobacterium phage MyraDee]|uniref:Uncharacterized protein n=1 Tax=Mycobacterium phage MyraDee TaxID=2024303 RepID=A0A222YY24_9CAUD|nr:hypothetical protein KIV66_gp91 [Mycobacterium phage MyraDee]ASR77198.1 hypothetical protein SEA_MYRADEE_91 [Mycobacterium phage MyraDee]
MKARLKTAVARLMVVGVALGAMALADPEASADPSYDAYAFEVGDDNGDGVIMEDESGWDCATMGNLICGPLDIEREG